MRRRDLFLNAQWSLMGARGDLLGMLVLPITTGTEWGRCPVLSVALEDTGECGVLGRMDQRHCQMWQFLCWAFISSFTVGSSPSDSDSAVKSSRSHNVSLESWGSRGRNGEKGCGFFQILSRLLFAWGFFPLRSAQLAISGWFSPLRNSYETIKRYEGVWDASVFWVLIT